MASVPSATVVLLGTPDLRGAVERWERRRFAGRAERELLGLTMLPFPRLVALVEHVDRVVSDGVEGAFVECGVWRGGASFLMAKRLEVRHGRTDRVWMFDSFEGMPAPKEIDGVAALQWAANRDAPNYFDNARASEEEVLAAAERLGLDDRVKTVKGWFEDILRRTREEVGPIALLRIDADWYDSVRSVLDELYDQVAPNEK